MELIQLHRYLHQDIQQPYQYQTDIQILENSLDLQTPT